MQFTLNVWLTLVYTLLKSPSEKQMCYEILTCCYENFCVLLTCKPVLSKDFFCILAVYAKKIY